MQHLNNQLALFRSVDSPSNRSVASVVSAMSLSCAVLFVLGKRARELIPKQRAAYRSKSAFFAPYLFRKHSEPNPFQSPAI